MSDTETETKKNRIGLRHSSNAFIGIGVAIGTAIGVATDNLAIGAGIGTVLGVALARFKSWKSK